jgi:hypothetical protein
MKRYRPAVFHLDTRAHFLTMEIRDDWEPEVRQNWLDQRERDKLRLVEEFGAQHSERKLADFIAIGEIPFSVVGSHSKFLLQARNAFVVGAYYPSLTASCALGERILNNLLLSVRDYYQDRPEYRKVGRVKSIDNWELLINTLAAWDVLLPDVADEFRRLLPMRLRSLHFNQDTEVLERQHALKAFDRIRRIVERQFGVGGEPWYISGTRGAFFIKRSYEIHPFVKAVILPLSVYVGPYHSVRHDMQSGRWSFADREYEDADREYEDREITDEEFASLYEHRVV